MHLRPGASLRQWVYSTSIARKQAYHLLTRHKVKLYSLRAFKQTAPWFRDMLFPRRSGSMRACFNNSLDASGQAAPSNSFSPHRTRLLIPPLMQSLTCQLQSTWYPFTTVGGVLQTSDERDSNGQCPWELQVSCVLCQLGTTSGATQHVGRSS